MTIFPIITSIYNLQHYANCPKATFPPSVVMYDHFFYPYAPKFIFKTLPLSLDPDQYIVRMQQCTETDTINTIIDKKNFFFASPTQQPFFYIKDHKFYEKIPTLLRCRDFKSHALHKWMVIPPKKPCRLEGGKR